MCNEAARSKLRTVVVIDREQLEEVTEYKYLEGLVTSGNERGSSENNNMVEKIWEV